MDPRKNNKRGKSSSGEEKDAAVRAVTSGRVAGERNESDEFVRARNKRESEETRSVAPPSGGDR